MFGAHFWRFCLCVLLTLGIRQAHSGVTWVSGSYPTIWDYEAVPLLNSGDLYYIKHVSGSGIALFYFFVRVDTDVHPNKEYQYWAWDINSNQIEGYKARLSEGVRSIYDGEEIVGQRYDRWDRQWGKGFGPYSIQADYWDTPLKGGWTIGDLLNVVWDIQGGGSGAPMTKIYKPTDSATTVPGELPPGHGDSPPNDGGGDPGDGGTDPGDGGGGTYPGDGGTNTGNIVVNVDGGMSADEFAQELANFFGYSANVSTNGLDNVEIVTDNIQTDIGFFDPNYNQSQQHEYPELDRFR